MGGFDLLSVFLTGSLPPSLSMKALPLSVRRKAFADAACFSAADAASLATSSSCERKDVRTVVMQSLVPITSL